MKVVDLTSADIQALLPPRPAEAHKGTFGHVLVIAGARGYTGAARLAVEGALRSGAGLVTAAVPEGVYPIVAGGAPEAITLPLPETATGSVSKDALSMALEAAGKRQAVVIGPGLSQFPETCLFIQEFIRRCPVPMVIDADALNALAPEPDMLKTCPAPVVVTPHPGEMARLTGLSTRAVQAERVQLAATWASRWECVVVLKGAGTIIAGDRDWVCRNTTGNAGLAKGGSGDVLAGLLGGLLAQGMSPWEGAQLGVYLHGLAADLAVREHSQRALLARDVLAALDDAWRYVESGGFHE